MDEEDNLGKYELDVIYNHITEGIRIRKNGTGMNTTKKSTFFFFIEYKKLTRKSKHNKKKLIIHDKETTDQTLF